MSVEKTNDAHAPASVAVPPYEPNPGFQTPVPIQPDHAQPQYMDTFASQQPQLPQQHENQLQMQQQKYPIATPLHALQSAPAPVDCTSCHQREMTQIQFESGKTTHGWAAVLCCCLCIGCLPYMMSSLKDARHHCAKCGVWLATWHNSGRVEIASAPPRKK